MKMAQKHSISCWTDVITQFLSVLTLIASANMTAIAASAVEELSNASIVEMKQLGLGETLIIEKIKASKCKFDLTLNGLKELKTANIPDSVISAMLAADKPATSSQERPEIPTAKSPATEKRLLPEFYGLYAITANGLVEMKRGAAALEVQPNVEFIYYAKTVAAAEMFGLFELPSPSRPVPTTRDGKFKGWADFLNQSQEHSDEIRGQIDGLPRGSVQVELRGKSVPGQPEMIKLNPATALLPGDYQIGIRGGSWYRLAITGRPRSPFGSSKAQPASTRHFGPPLKILAAGDDTSHAATFHSPPEVLQNPASPIIIRAVEAHGGVANILRLTATRLRVTGRTWMEGQGFVEMTMVIYSKYPEQLRQDAVYQLNSGQVDQVLSFNNGDTYGYGRGKTFSPAKATKEALRNEVFMQRVESLRPLMEGKYRFTQNENVAVSGKSLSSVTVSDGNFDVTLLFDPDTSLLARRRFSKMDLKGKKADVEVVYSKHIKLGGLMVPGRVEGYEAGALRYESNVQEMTPLEDVPDVYFIDPSLAVP